MTVSNNVHYDYKLNNLNQLVQKSYSSNDKEGTLYTYDGRGNLVKEEYGKLNGNGNSKRTTVAEYTYDETNKMVKGVNSIGESSSYLFNGKDALVEQTWKIAKNGYGYHDVDAGVSDPADTSSNSNKGGNGSGGKGKGNGNGQGNGNGKGDKPTGTTVGSFSTVVKQFVIDYTRETQDPLMEHEVNGLDYRYVYGNERLSVNVSPITNGSGHIVESGTVGQQIRLYYHQDLRGTVDYLTSPVSQKVESWTHYNEWGEITHNAVLKCGQRELDLVKNYTGHDFDAVLNMYYAKARMYDAENRRFVALDPIMDGSVYDISERVTDPMMFAQYLYVKNMPLVAIDPLGLVVYYIYDPNMWDKVEYAENVAGMWKRTLDTAYDTDTQVYTIDSWEAFKKTWDALDDEVEAIVLNTHGAPEKMWINGEEVTLDQISGLAAKRIDMMILLECNAGHLNYSDNVAERFAALDGVTKVVADDGTTYNWYREASIESLGDEIRNRKRYPDWVFYRDLDVESNDVTGNYCYTYNEQLMCGELDEQRTKSTGNAGWIMYQDGYRVQIVGTNKISMGVLVEAGRNFDVYNFDLTATKEYSDARTRFQNTLAWKVVLNRFATLDEADIVTAWMKSSYDLYDTVQLLKEIERLQSEE